MARRPVMKLALLIALVIAAAGCPNQSKHEAIKRANTGAKALSQKQYDTAITEFKEAVRLDRDNFTAWYQLGEAHYHHQAPSFPPPPGYGNAGTALRAFQRALALDSTYVVAYRHILDGLGTCAAPNNGLICLADSAAYGFAPDLVRRYGQATVDSAKRVAREAQITTARGWVSIEPTLPLQPV